MGRRLAIKKGPEYSSDEELLRFINKEIVSQVQDGIIKPEAGDLLNIMEIQKRLSSDARAEEKFWEMIEQIRQEELKNA